MENERQYKLDRALYNECSRAGKWMREQVKLLIELGANPNTEFGDGDLSETALTAAVQAHHPVDLLQLLFHSGADMNKLSETAMKIFVEKLDSRNTVFNELVNLHKKYPDKINLGLIYECSLITSTHVRKLYYLKEYCTDPTIFEQKTIQIKDDKVLRHILANNIQVGALDLRLFPVKFFNEKTIKSNYKIIVNCTFILEFVCERNKSFLKEYLPRLISSMDEPDVRKLIKISVNLLLGKYRCKKFHDSSRPYCQIYNELNLPYNILYVFIEEMRSGKIDQTYSLHDYHEIMKDLARLWEIKTFDLYATNSCVLSQIYNNPKYYAYATVKLEPDNYILLVPPHFNVIKTVTEIRSLYSTVWSLIPNEILFEIFSMIVC